jgi:hypothetical protein
MSVFGLVLLEQLFRNVSPDFRWSIKPLCLGLGGTFLFDLYLFSDALLFNQIDVRRLQHPRFRACGELAAGRFVGDPQPRRGSAVW